MKRITTIEQQSVKRPVVAPRKSVKRMVQEYEDNIIPPPPQFRDGCKPVPKRRTIKKNIMPVASPRAKIEEKTKALKGYTKSFRIAIRNDSDPLK